MNGLQTFLQIIHHIIVQIGLQHIFNRCPIFFFYINNIRKNRCCMIPVLDCYAKTSHFQDNLPLNRSGFSADHVHSFWNPVSCFLRPVHCASLPVSTCVCSICSFVFSWCCCNCSRSTFFISSSFSLYYSFLFQLFELARHVVAFLLLSAAMVRCRF